MKGRIQKSLITFHRTTNGPLRETKYLKNCLIPSQIILRQNDNIYSPLFMIADTSNNENALHIFTKFPIWEAAFSLLALYTIWGELLLIFLEEKLGGTFGIELLVFIESYVF